MAGAAVQMADRTKRNKMRKKKPSKEASKKSIKWSDSLLSKDPLSVLTSGNEGGFLSLEEIDESEYGLIGEVTETVVDDNSRNKKNKNNSLPDSKKRKRDGNEGEKETNKKNDKRKKKKNTNKIEKDEDETDIVKTEMLGEDEVYSWTELRLHPLIIKSIQRLGFKKPTPIQKACIPAAAQQGKDVIGAAETGSGKTLAFGLPILQRLLEERDKNSRSVQESDKLSEKLSEDNNTQSPLRALIITPTRELAIQVCDHLKQVAEGLDIYVVPIVGGMSSEKQERLLKRGPHIVVGTPGRLWELMSAGHQHLVELHSLSFFVLDEADRMIETGHYHELQSIIDLLPKPLAAGPHTPASDSHTEFPNLQRKKRQTLVFSATISLSDNFRRKLKKGGGGGRDASRSTQDGLGSIEVLSERAGVRSDAAVIDLTNTDIMASRLEESFIECGEEDKDAYLYYILSVHGQGRTIIFCTSIAALRHLSSILRLLKVNSWTLHAQMQQRARLKAMDRFRANDNAVLVATDVAARGLDIPHVRTVVHYQLPHSAEVYIHRSGRTARASKDGCSIALISPNDKIKFHSLCRSLSKESLKQFPVDNAFMPEVMSRLSLARQVDKIMRKNSQETAKKNWIEKNAEALGVELDVSDSEEEREREIINKKIKIISSLIKKTQQELRNREIGDKEIISSHLEKAQQELRSKGINDKEIISSQIKKAQQQIRTGEISDKKIISSLLKKAQQELSAKGIRDEIISPQLRKAQQELNEQLAKPLQPRTLSHRYLAGGGVTLELQKQLEELSKQKVPAGASEKDKKKSNFVVIGHNNLVEPLQALRTSGLEVSMNFEKKKEMQKRAEIWKKKKREEKKKDREQKRKARKKAKEQRM